MNTAEAFVNGYESRHKKSMVFDWDKAARLIKESGFKNASAGLSGDWEFTGGDIFIDGEIFKDDYTYLTSTWAEPEIEIEGKFQECFIMDDDYCKWNCGTKWPDSAIKLLNN